MMTPTTGHKTKSAEDALAKAIQPRTEGSHGTIYSDSVAFALRGSPKRAFLVLAGPKAGGKSTLLSAFKACLGDVKVRWLRNEY